MKSQMELERLAREGGKELRDRGERELIVELRLNYKLFKCTNKHQLEDEGPWSPASLIIRIDCKSN